MKPIIDNWRLGVSRLHALAGLIVSLVLFGSLPQTLAQSDNFDDGNDDGWTRHDREGTATFSFTNGGYRISASSSPGGTEQDKASVFSLREEDYGDFYVAVDLADWDNDVRSAIGLAFRMQNVGTSAASGYVLYWTPAIGGGGNRLFSIFVIFNNQPLTALNATFLTLDPNKSYRMAVKGTGGFFEATIYDLNDLTHPLVYMSGTDNSLLPSQGFGTHGQCGLFAYSRNNTTVDVTYDNYFAAAEDPEFVPLPATWHPVPGTPQVVNRLPASNKNFHPAVSGISFTATTVGGNAINNSGINLLLNGNDVSSALNIGGSGDTRTVTYTGLESNRLYHASIRLTETGGKTSTNDFYFDTFSEALVTDSASELVEVEDYNYDSGQYQDNPTPSGFTSGGTQVNGNGVGYLDKMGVAGVDFSDRRTTPEGTYNQYRLDDPVGTFPGSLYFIYVDPSLGQVNVLTNDTPLQKFESLDLPDYQIQHTEGGEWLNYTRLFPAGKYNAYLRTSSYSPQDVLLDEVTGDRTMGGQTTAPIGSFHVVNTGHLSAYRYFPLVDNSGNLISLDWSGEKTFRLTMGGVPEDLTRYALQLNYVMFVPAQTPLLELITPSKNGNVFSVSFLSQDGVTHTLQYRESLTTGSWTSLLPSVTGDGTVKILMDNSATVNTRFYQILSE